MFVASMNLRGVRAPRPKDVDYYINVTSAQGKQHKHRLIFSPMTPIEGGYKGYWNFEHYWQSGKVFEGVPQEKSKDWWKKQIKPKKRYPAGRNKKILYAVFDKERLDYIDSRKKIYVPEYYNLIKDNKLIKFYQDEFQKGKSFVIYDFDGPRKEDRGVDVLKLTKGVLINKINDPRTPFGHGYIVAATIMRIEPSEYTK